MKKYLIIALLVSFSALGCSNTNEPTANVNANSDKNSEAVKENKSDKVKTITLTKADS